MACYLCKGCCPKCGSKLLEVYPEGAHGCEEKCCPSFWYDTGVPQLPLLSWVFDPENAWLNKNNAMERFGGIGYRYCDARRKRFMGTALAFTVLASIFATWGVMSLSSDLDTLRYAAWGTAYIKNETYSSPTDDPRGPVAVKYYLGLVKLVVDRCYSATGDQSRFWDCELLSATYWKDVNEAVAVEAGFSWDATKECKAEVLGMQMGAFSTTATIVFALNGCLTRIRRVADTNFQKLLGCLPDMWGALSLCLALIQFSLGCYIHMPRTVNGLQVNYYIGPAFGSYSFVLVGGILRCILHWLTPVPRRGCANYCCVVKQRKNRWRRSDNSWMSAKVLPDIGEPAKSQNDEEATTELVS